MDQKFFIKPFAFAGDVAAIPDDVQVDGSVSYDQGWGFDYQRELGVDPLAKPVPRDQTNGLMNAITANLGQYQRNGSPEFITAADNGGVAYGYDLGATVKWRATGGDPWLFYVSREANNTAVPSDATKWQQLIFVESTALQATTGTDGTTIMTPRRVAAAIAASSISIPAASETVAGILELATQAEVNTGTDDLRAVTPLKLATAIPVATTATAGRTRYATSAETSGLSVTNAAVTPGGLATLAGTKATLGASVSFSQVACINTGTPTVGYTTYGNTGLRFFGWDGSSYVVGDAAGAPLSVWHSGNFNPAAKANLTANTFSADQLISAAQAQWKSFTPGGIQAYYGAADSLGYAFIGSFTNHAFKFYSNSVVRGEITAGGALVWVADIQVGQSFSSGTTSVRLAPGAPGTVNLRPNGPGSAVGEAVLNTAGQFSSVSFNTTSSRKIKDLEPGPTPYGLREVLQIETAVGKYKETYAPDGRRRLFVIAEQLAEVVPEAVFEDSAEVTIDGETMLVPTVEMTQLIPVLINAVKELSAALDEERQRREIVEGRLAALEG